MHINYINVYQQLCIFRQLCLIILTMYVKYCKSEYNIHLSCNTVKLGTLREYRESYPGFVISDPEEGVAGIKLEPGRILEVTPKDSDKIPLARGLKRSNDVFGSP